MIRFAFSFLLLLAFILSNFGALDCYAQWIQQRSGVTVHLNDIVMLDSMMAIAVGNAGIILKTTNAGQTWAIKDSGGANWNAVAFATPLRGLIVGDRTSAALTTDGGESWARWSGGGLRNWTSVWFTTPMHVWIGDGGGDDSAIVMLSTNGGINWREFTNFGAGPIRGIFGSRGAFLFFTTYVITPYVAYKTTDFGLTWTAGSLPIRGLASAARGDMSPGGNVSYIAGYDGDFTSTPLMMMRAPTDTLWRRWMMMPVVSPGELLDVSAPTPQVAYACGRGGLIYKTTDAGKFWMPSLQPIRREFYAIHFFNEHRGFAVGDWGTIFFTANGGTINRPPLPFHLLRPTNGDTMTIPRSISFSWNRAIDNDGDSVWYSLFLSSDRGATWRPIGMTSDTALQVHNVGFLFDPGSYSWKVFALDGMAATPSLDVFTFTVRSADAGGLFIFRLTESDGNVWSLQVMRDSLWQRYRIPLSAFGSGGGFLNTPVTEVALVPVGGGTIAGRSTEVVDWIDHLTIANNLIDNFDDGNYADWQAFVATNGSYLQVQSDSRTPDGSPRCLRMTHGNNLFGTFAGWLVKTLSGGLQLSPSDTLSFWLRGASYVVTDVEREPTETPRTFALHQNYPNPFNPTTTIEYDLRTNSFVQLSVFNVLGEKVAAFVNRVEGGGKHSVEFDASDLASGIYIYRLEAEGFVATRKFVLIR